MWGKSKIPLKPGENISSSMTLNESAISAGSLVMDNSILGVLPCRGEKYSVKEISGEIVTVYIGNDKTVKAHISCLRSCQ